MTASGNPERPSVESSQDHKNIKGNRSDTPEEIDESFNIYSRPVKFYLLLKRRQKNQPVFLRRNLSYNREAKKVAASKLPSAGPAGPVAVQADTNSSPKRVLHVELNVNLPVAWCPSSGVRHPNAGALPSSSPSSSSSSISPSSNLSLVLALVERPSSGNKTSEVQKMVLHSAAISHSTLPGTTSLDPTTTPTTAAPKSTTAASPSSSSVPPSTLSIRSDTPQLPSSQQQATTTSIGNSPGQFTADLTLPEPNTNRKPMPLGILVLLAGDHPDLGMFCKSLPKTISSTGSTDHGRLFGIFPQGSQLMWTLLDINVEGLLDQKDGSGSANLPLRSGAQPGQPVESREFKSTFSKLLPAQVFRETCCKSGKMRQEVVVRPAAPGVKPSSNSKQQTSAVKLQVRVSSLTVNPASTSGETADKRGSPQTVATTTDPLAVKSTGSAATATATTNNNNNNNTTTTTNNNNNNTTNTTTNTTTNNTTTTNNNNNNNSSNNTNNNTTTNPTTVAKPIPYTVPFTAPTDLWFHYLYSKQASRWKTERTSGFRCPFCHAPTGSASGMHAHLQLEHDLFAFTWTASGEDITVACRSNKMRTLFQGKLEDSEKILDASFQHISAGRYSMMRQQAARLAAMPAQEDPEPFSLESSPASSPEAKTAEQNGSYGSESGNNRSKTRFKSMSSKLLKDPASRPVPADKKTNSQGSPVEGQLSGSKRKLPQESWIVRAPGGLGKEGPSQVFFHSRTCQPLTDEEMRLDIDSEDEVDCVDFEREDRRALDEFVDVPPEEKEIMHLWNTFVHQNPPYSDRAIGMTCDKFSMTHGPLLAGSPSLSRAFLLHLLNLSDFGLLTPANITKCFKTINSYTCEKEET